MEEFKNKVLETVENILNGISQSPMYKIAVKPIVTFAKPELEDMLDKNPKEVYEWLIKARIQLTEAIEIYEKENKP